MLRSILAVVFAFGVASCASLAPYGPSMSPSGQGYTEQRIETDRYRITYRGVGAPGPVADLALFRAAELTLEQGGDWFEITQRYIDGRADSAGGVRPSLSVGAGSGSYRSPYGGRYSASGVGLGVGLNFSAPSPTSTVLEIRIGRGPLPDGAYNPRDVVASLRS